MRIEIGKSRCGPILNGGACMPPLSISLGPAPTLARNRISGVAKTLPEAVIYLTEGGLRCRATWNPHLTPYLVLTEAENTISGRELLVIIIYFLQFFDKRRFHVKEAFWSFLHCEKGTNGKWCCDFFFERFKYLGLLTTLISETSFCF